MKRWQVCPLHQSNADDDQDRVCVGGRRSLKKKKKITKQQDNIHHKSKNKQTRGPGFLITSPVIRIVNKQAYGQPGPVTARERFSGPRFFNVADSFNLFNFVY